MVKEPTEASGLLDVAAASDGKLSVDICESSELFIFRRDNDKNPSYA